MSTYLTTECWVKVEEAELGAGDAGWIEEPLDKIRVVVNHV